MAVMEPKETFEGTLNHVRTGSRPSDLRITDMRFVDIAGAPMHCILMKLYTNQGLVGYGEVRDFASRRYALMLKHILIGENPCDIDRIFRRIKQFGFTARQAGGVCAVEVALWDLAGKAYGIPIWQMLGGKFRDKIRIYCDTDVDGKHTGTDMGNALKARMDKGFTFLKMDLGLGILRQEKGTLTAPLGYMESFGEAYRAIDQARESGNDLALREAKRKLYDMNNVAHPFTGIHVTDHGLDVLENYVREVRAVIGYDVPLAIDHFGHICVEDCIKLCRRVEKFNLAWAEDMIPWQYTDQYVRLRNSTTTPICTGEDIFLKENFKPLLEKGGVSVIHPDILSSGGILENKKISDMAQDYGVAMAVHMAESPIACMAAVHSIAASENFLALEYHSVDVDWWDDMVTGLPRPLVDNGWITVPDKPGLGIDTLVDEVLAEHLHPQVAHGLWDPTDEWNDDIASDRLWS